MMCGYDFALEFQHWANLMKGKDSPFAERDTILHLILPVLNIIGFKSEMIVQGKNDHSSNEKKLWDINCYSFCLAESITKADDRMQKPLLVVEAKSVNKPLGTARSVSDKETTFSWTPNFTDSEFKDIHNILRDNIPEEKAKKDDFQKKVNHINDELKKLGLNKEIISCKFDKLVKHVSICHNAIITVLNGEENSGWTDNERKFLRFAIQDGINADTKNFFGEVWRDCTDGKHIFAADMTIPILTNGIEWLFMKPDFYAENKVPKIVWHSKNGYGCIKTEDNDTYLKSFNIPIVEPGEINFMNNCNKVVEVVNAMRQYIISTLRC